MRPAESEGMVYGTGWAADGIWNYFASFYAHAWLWVGEGRQRRVKGGCARKREVGGHLLT